MAGDLDQIGEKGRGAIDSEDNRIVISAVVIWEVAIKRGLGKLDAPSDLLERLERASVDLLPITARHADLVGALPVHHRDPFDRLLVAQAQTDGLVLVSGDEQLSRYQIDVIW